MTYQPPYQPPTGYPGFDYYQPDALAPARRASTMLFVVGAVAILGSFCCGGIGVMIPQLMQQPEFASKMEGVPGVTPDMMRVVMMVAAGLSLIVGIIYIVLGIFVRRGSKGAAITAMVLSILAALLLLFWIISAFSSGGGSPPEKMLGACVMVIPLSLIVLLIVWLIGAIKAPDQGIAAQYAMQYWQYAQQQQMYGQNPYGTPQQQPPPSPPSDLGPPPAA